MISERFQGSNMMVDLKLNSLRFKTQRMIVLEFSVWTSNHRITCNFAGYLSRNEEELIILIPTISDLGFFPTKDMHKDTLPHQKWSDLYEMRNLLNRMRNEINSFSDFYFLSYG